jgi:hypothetical protein
MGRDEAQAACNRRGEPRDRKGQGPQGMNVRVGDRVEVIGGHLDPNLPCHYIPKMITRELSQ